MFSADELSRDECLSLLRGASIGRVVHTDGALPSIVPVPFAVHGNAVIFRAPADSRLARTVDGAVVAFEADDLRRIGSTGSVGWSVVVTGTAAVVRDVSRLIRLEHALLATADPDALCIRITATFVTGQLLSAPLVQPANA